MEKFDPLFIAFFVAMLAAGAFACWLDYSTSADPMSGTVEKNPLVKDELGYFSARKFWTAHGVLLIVPAALFAFMGGWAGFSYALLVPLKLMKYFANKKALKSAREKQFRFLSGLRVLHYGTPEFDDYFNRNRLNFQNVNGRKRYSLFGWLYSDRHELSEAVTEIHQKIFNWSQRRETEWFR
jgi:hypothetical protein